MTEVARRRVGWGETTRRRPHGPGVFYGALTLALLVLVSVLALTARQPPPPTIAEFAPQAVEQIADAPSEQSSDFGSGTGDCPPGAVCGPGGEGAGLAAPAPPAIQVPRVRKCVGDPPRQIEDPQSPPCVPYWEGDNGGETWQGVTADEIRIVKPRGDLPNATIEAFFNKRFEFYGRKIRFIQTSDVGGEAEQKAAAVQADEVHRAFASLDSHDDHPYFAELALREVIAVTGQSQFSDSDLKKWDPYVWQYPMTADLNFRALAEMACARLQGRKATHAGDPRLTSSDRVFGIVIHEEWAEFSDLDSSALDEGLARCGTRSRVTKSPGRDTAAIKNAMIEMQTAGVTSIFCMCHIFANLDQYFASATSQGYFPEWIVSSYVMLDADPMLHLFANYRDQLAHTFGITVRPRQWPIEETPLWWAMKEMDPSYDERISTNWFFAMHQYQAMLLLASGIQMAGPNLTPQTFKEGLEKTVFPNPDHPLMAGKVGFRGAPRSMTVDAAEWWWSNSDRSPYPDQGTGTICYVDGGARRTLGAWPRGADPFFSGPCDSGARQ